MTDDCPVCAGRGRVVTAVTVRTMGDNPRSVLVTRLCSAAGCHHKYTVLKPEQALTEEETGRWHDA